MSFPSLTRVWDWSVKTSANHFPDRSSFTITTTTAAVAADIQKNALVSRYSTPHVARLIRCSLPHLRINNRNEDGRMPSEIDIALLCSLSLKNKCESERVCVCVCAFLAFDFRAAVATHLPFSFALFQFQCINLAFLVCCVAPCWHQVDGVVAAASAAIQPIRIDVFTFIVRVYTDFSAFLVMVFCVCFSFSDLLDTTHTGTGAGTPSQNPSL